MSIGPGAAKGSAPRAVDPINIERELTTLWREAAEARRRAGVAGMTNRILLHTLVICSTESLAAEQAREVATALSPRQPARTIVLEALQDETPAGLTATVALRHAPPRDGDEPVCGEMVTIAARGPEAIRRLPGAVLPLLLTNLPSFLWWQHGSPFQQAALQTLSPVMDRLIVDSLTFAAPDHDLADLDRAVTDPHFAPKVSDLAWARLAPWRYLTAQIFDASAVRPFLSRVRQVKVRYHSGPPVLAWLYAGWLASRLGWVPISREVQSMRFEGGQVVEFEALPAAAELGPGAFAGARLQAEGGAVFEVSRMGVEWTVTHLDMEGLHTERVVHLSDETITEWLGHELSRLASVPTYEAAIRLLAEKSEANADFIG